MVGREGGSQWEMLQKRPPEEQSLQPSKLGAQLAHADVKDPGLVACFSGPSWPVGLNPTHCWSLSLLSHSVTLGSFTDSPLSCSLSHSFALRNPPPTSSLLPLSLSPPSEELLSLPSQTDGALGRRGHLYLHPQMQEEAGLVAEAHEEHLVCRGWHSLSFVCLSLSGSLQLLTQHFWACFSNTFLDGNKNSCAVSGRRN